MDETSKGLAKSEDLAGATTAELHREVLGIRKEESKKNKSLNRYEDGIQATVRTSTESEKVDIA